MLRGGNASDGNDALRRERTRSWCTTGRSGPPAAAGRTRNTPAANRRGTRKPTLCRRKPAKRTAPWDRRKSARLLRPQARDHQLAAARNARARRGAHRHCAGPGPTPAAIRLTVRLVPGRSVRGPTVAPPSRSPHHERGRELTDVQRIPFLSSRPPSLRDVERGSPDETRRRIRDSFDRLVREYQRQNVLELPVSAQARRRSQAGPD